MKVLFLIISLLINLAVCNNGSNLENLKNETEEYVDYAPEDNLSFSVIENAVEERYYYNEPLILHIEITKANNSITNVSILPTIIYGNVNYSIGTNVIYFNEDESSFTLQINHVTQGNSHMRLELTPSTNDNNSISLDKTYINIYFVGELNFYCFSTLSITRARQIACHFLVFDGIIEDELGPIDEYIYQEPNAYYFTSTTINEEKNIIDGLFNFQSEDLNYYPADGVKVGLYAYDTNDNIVYFDETYIDEVGYFSLNLETTSYSKLSLIFFAETKYVRFCESYTTEKIGDKTYYYFNNPYEYEINLTDNVTKTLGKKYTINNLYTNFDNDRGLAFGNAMIMNAGGRFLEEFLEYNYNEDPLWVVFPSDRSSFHNNKDANVKFINLSDYGQEGALHEYGHYVHKSLGLIKPFSGFMHDDTEDLALRYPDFQDGNYYKKGRGYYAAWAEGFATFYSNLVQNYYDYSHLSETWKDEYVEFQNLNTKNVNFVLRESNEKTITNVLLSLCDPQFRYDDAIGIKTFFDLLVENKDDVASLSDALNIVEDNIPTSKNLISKVTSYYKIAPNNLKMSKTIVRNNGVKYEETQYGMFEESKVLNFTWEKGNYVYFDKYLTYKDNGYGDRYTSEEAETNPSAVITKYGLSNNNFTLYVYNDHGIQLLKKENLICNNINKSKFIYTPTNQEWKSLFFSSSFTGYWFVEAKDINNSIIGVQNGENGFTSTGGYVYRSEMKPFTLEKRYIEHKTQINQPLSGLEIDFTLQENNTTENNRDFTINLEYEWTTIPEQRYDDYIIMSWSTIYELNGTFYIESYYNNNIEISSTNSYGNNYQRTPLGINQLYWVVNMKWFDENNNTPYALYGNAEIGLTAPSTANALFISVEYHHITNTASGMAGIFNDETNDNKYTTLSDFKAKVYRTYSF